jgi:hypothetical protein
MGNNNFEYNRLRKLAGIINENVIDLKSDTGRSDEGTLSWYSEDYLLDLGSNILNKLDTIVESENGLKLSLLRSSTKMTANSLFIDLKINGDYESKKIDEEINITLTVQFSENSNTLASVKYRGIINRFNLNSKHSSEDLEKFINEVVDNVMNSIKLSNINPKK